MEILNYLLSNRDKIIKILTNIDYYYLSYPIPKKNGKLRWIDAPQGELKELQNKILKEFLYKFRPHQSAIGFVKNKNVKQGALKHFGNKIVLRIDIKDFFESFTLPIVTDFFTKALKRYKKKGYVIDNINLSWLATILSKLCTYKGRLPQGASTSPAITNLICYKLDEDLTNYAIINNLVYTRYADDMTFSSKDKNFNMDNVIAHVNKYLLENYVYLKINTKKTKIMRPHNRMVVTGVVINQKLGVPRYKYKNLRAKLYNIQKCGKELTTSEYQKILGQIKWIGFLDKDKGMKLEKTLGKIPLKNQ